MLALAPLRNYFVYREFKLAEVIVDQKAAIVKIKCHGLESR